MTIIYIHVIVCNVIRSTASLDEWSSQSMCIQYVMYAMRYPIDTMTPSATFLIDIDKVNIKKQHMRT